jgi:hypothetical protein
MAFTSAFQTTRYRVVSEETRGVFWECFGSLSADDEYREPLLFGIENALLRHDPSRLTLAIRDLCDDGAASLVRLQSLSISEGTRPDARCFDLRTNAVGWDVLTGGFLRTDYSRRDMLRIVALLENNSAHVIQTAVKHTPKDMPLTYLEKVVISIASKNIVQLRREETFAQSVAASRPITLPTYVNPGYLSATVDDEVRWRQMDAHIAYP